MKKPNLFLVGPPKCGTSAMYVFLKQHPDIFMSNKKEPCFFAYGLGNFKSYGFHQKGNYEEYLGWFKNADKEKVLGEASTIYFRYEDVPRRIKTFNPKAKIIAGSREPSTFLKSYYYYCAPGESYSSFEKKRFFMHDGTVNPQVLLFPAIKRYHEIFGEEFRVYKFEDFKQEPLALMKELYGFLDVDPSFSPNLKTVNKTYPLGRFSSCLLRPFASVPALTGKLGINAFIKRNFGQENIYSIFKKHYMQTQRSLQRRLSTKNVPEICINPTLLSALEADYQKALSYCKDNRILL